MGTTLGKGNVFTVGPYCRQGGRGVVNFHNCTHLQKLQALTGCSHNPLPDRVLILVTLKMT